MRLTLPSLSFALALASAAAAFAPTPAAAQVGAHISTPTNPTFVVGSSAGAATITWGASTLTTTSTAIVISVYVIHIRVAGEAWSTARFNAVPSGVMMEPIGGEIVTDGIDAAFNPATTGATVTGLQVGMIYEMRVRANESSSNHSFWTTPISLTVIDPSKDVTLTGLTVAGGTLHPTFDAAVTDYGVGVTRLSTSGAMQTVTFTPTLPTDATAVGAVGGSTMAAAISYGTDTITGVTNHVVLINGNSLGVVEYVLTVTSSGSSTTQAYNFNIIVGPDISVITIEDATAGGGTDNIPLTPAFNRNQLTYTAGTTTAITVPNAVATVNVKGTWTMDGPDATIGIRGTTLTAVTDNTGTSGNDISLAVGVNIIDLVFDKTGSAKVDTTYTFRIRRMGTGPEVSFASAASEVEEGASTMLTVNLSAAAPSGGLSVAFTASGSATLTDDYTITASPLAVAAGATTATITIDAATDNELETLEDITVALADGTGYQLAETGTAHTVTIIDPNPPSTIGLIDISSGSDDTFVVVAWDAPLGTLGDNPYEARWRVQSPQGLWTSKRGADLGDTAGGSDCANFPDGTLGSDCRQAQLDGLRGPGVVYEFELRAFNDHGSGVWSGGFFVTNSGTIADPPLAPTALAGTAVINGVELTWTAPTVDDQGAAITVLDYRLRYRRTDADGAAGAGTTAGEWQGWVNSIDIAEILLPTIGDNDDGFALGQATTGYMLGGLAGGEEYEIEVAAVVGEVVGAWDSLTFTAGVPTTPPDPPAAPTTKDVGIESFTVSWTKVVAASGYNVRWRTAAIAASDPDGTPNSGDEIAAAAAGRWQDASGNNDDGVELGDVVEYTIEGLVHSIAYDYAVRARNNIGPGAWTEGATPQNTAVANNNASASVVSIDGDEIPDLFIGDGNPRLVGSVTTFDANMHDYLVLVDEGAGMISFGVVPADLGNASQMGVILNGATSVRLGTNIALSERFTGNDITFAANEYGIVEYRITITAQDRTTTNSYDFTIITGPVVSAISLAEEGGDAIPLEPAFDTYGFTYDAGEVPSTTRTVNFNADWTGAPASGAVGRRGAGATAITSGTDKPIALASGENFIELKFGGGTANGDKDPLTYTIKITREGGGIEEMTQKAEAVAKSVSAAVVLSGVLDAVSQNAFDATGSFTPFVDVGAERATESRQALVPVAPRLLSEQPQGRDGDWRELLGASSFRLGITAGEFGEALGGGEWSVWGSGDVRGFNGGGDVETEGLGYSVYLGTDYKKGNWLAGIAAGYSSTTADITAEGVKTSSEFWLAGGYPYLRYSWQNQIDAWLLLGAGGGQLTLKDAEDASAFVVSHLYAAGAKANVLRAGRLSLAAKADVAANFALSVSTDNLNDFETMQQRVRVGVDAAYDYRGATHGLRPHLEVGARIDFGAGESDLIAGAEVAGGIRYEFQPLRLSLDARGRALVYDTTGLLREWGAGATIRMTPRANGEGISASLTPGWGAPQSRVDNMWQNDTPTLTQTPTQALTLRGELAYTFKHKDARITPLTQYSLNAQSQTVGIGTRLNLAPLSLELLGERVDYTTTPDDYRLRLNTSLRF